MVSFWAFTPWQRVLSTGRQTYCSLTIGQPTWESAQAGFHKNELRRKPLDPDNDEMTGNNDKAGNTKDAQGAGCVVLSRRHWEQNQDGKQDCLSSVCVYGGSQGVSNTMEFKARVTECSCEEPEGATDVALRTAPALAFRNAAKSAASRSLEPVISLEITTASDSAGGVMGDLNARRGTVREVMLCGDTQVLRAWSPRVRLPGFSTAVGLPSGGRAGDARARWFRGVAAYAEGTTTEQVT